MEASQAATAQGQAQGNGESAATDQGQGGTDVAQLAQQFDSFSQGQQELLEILKSQQGQQQEPGAEPPAEQMEPLDLSFLDETSPQYDPQVTAERFQEMVDQRVQHLVQQQVDPVRKEIRDERIAREMTDLAYERPELQDEIVVKEVFNLAKQRASIYGNPRLAEEPMFIRDTYDLLQAHKAMEQEGAESPRAAHLEGGGGAAPSSSQVDLGDQIVRAGQGGRSVLPF